MSERDASANVADRFGIGISTLRRWDKKVRDNANNFNVLYEKSSRPPTIHYRIRPEVVTLMLAVRALYGWGAQRIARVFKAEIEHDLITPYYPESNGKVEALIKTINRECLRM